MVFKINIKGLLKITTIKKWIKWLNLEQRNHFLTKIETWSWYIQYRNLILIFICSSMCELHNLHFSVSVWSTLTNVLQIWNPKRPLKVQKRNSYLLIPFCIGHNTRYFYMLFAKAYSNSARQARAALFYRKRNLRLREIMQFSLHHTASKW